VNGLCKRHTSCSGNGGGRTFLFVDEDKQGTCLGFVVLWLIMAEGLATIALVIGFLLRLRLFALWLFDFGLIP
jgi:F0F1-type ATP synthase membrane subunit c/vacuolar-type H+-ATPase subunit K